MKNLQKLSIFIIFILGLMGCSDSENTESRNENKIKIGVITFLSGPAAVFGVPAKKLISN